MASSTVTECSTRSRRSGAFSLQVLSDDHSCRDAVSRIIAHRATQGIEACSPNTASYCNARIRLPTDVLRTLTRRTAQELQTSVPDEWKWRGRSVFIVDGSRVSMPDTAQNQQAYPQTPTPKPGIGFPLARNTMSLSLATGACHDLAIAPYAGKGTGETTLMRKMYDSLRPGDVALADALFDNYFLICELRERGIDIVTRVKYERSSSEIVERGPVPVSPGASRPATYGRFKTSQPRLVGFCSQRVSFAGAICLCITVVGSCQPHLAEATSVTLCIPGTEEGLPASRVPNLWAGPLSW